MTKNELSLKPLIDASKLLEDAINQAKDDLDRDGVIQRFEYTFELAWKALKRYLELFCNIREDNIKNILREAGKQGLIESVQAWFDYQNARNLTSHTYSGRVAQDVFLAAKKFSRDVLHLILKLEAMIGQPRAN